VPQNEARSPAFRSPPALASPNGSLLGVDRRMAAIPPLQLEGARDPPPGPETAAVPWASCCASPGMEPQPWAIPLCPPPGRSAQGLELRTPQCGRVWALDPLNGRVWVSEQRRRGGRWSSTWWKAGANYGLALCPTHNPRVFSGRDLCGSISTRTWWIHGGLDPPPIAPPVWPIDRGDSVSKRLEWQSGSPVAGLAAMCAG